MVNLCTTKHNSATRPTPDSVIDAVCADPELLTLEFEAIMAANYPAVADQTKRRPPRTLLASATRQTRPVRPAHHTTRTPGRAAHGATPKRHQRARQRGPPTRARRRGLTLDPRPERRLRLPTEPTGPVALPAANALRLPVCARHPPQPRSGSSAQHQPAPAPTALHDGDRPTEPNSSGRPSTPAITIQPPSTQHNRTIGTTVLVGGTPPTRTLPPGHQCRVHRLGALPGALPQIGPPELRMSYASRVCGIPVGVDPFLKAVGHPTLAGGVRRDDPRNDRRPLPADSTGQIL
jgi:hypothetical protein